jgi:hypothetical protein
MEPAMGEPATEEFGSTGAVANNLTCANVVGAFTALGSIERNKS